MCGSSKLRHLKVSKQFSRYFSSNIMAKSGGLTGPMTKQQREIIELPGSCCHGMLQEGELSWRVTSFDRGTMVLSLR